MPSPLSDAAGISYESLSDAEQAAQHEAQLSDADRGLGFTPEAAFRKAHRAGWLAGRLWMLDHLVAMSSEQPEAIVDVALRQRTPMVPLTDNVWRAIDSAVEDARTSRAPRGLSRIDYDIARRWLDGVRL